MFSPPSGGWWYYCPCVMELGDRGGEGYDLTEVAQ